MAEIRRNRIRSYRDTADNRCSWAGTDPIYVEYHDREWGVPIHRDKQLFEFLILEGAQAGLSWITILKRREAYRKAFDNFEVEQVARFSKRKVTSLLKNLHIVRNRLKIESAIKNAQAFIKIQEEFGSFDTYQWNFVNGQPIINRWKKVAEIPANTDISDQLSRDLKRRGFSFVGSTIIYAHMQAVGMVNDHVLSCFRHQELYRSFLGC